LHGQAAAIETFFENNKKPYIPYIAVAVNDSILLYHNYKKYFMYNVPNIDISEIEITTWNQLYNDQIMLDQATEIFIKS